MCMCICVCVYVFVYVRVAFNSVGYLVVDVEGSSTSLLTMGDNHADTDPIVLPPVG